jgi:hypothetical protein
MGSGGFAVDLEARPFNGDLAQIGEETRSRDGEHSALAAALESNTN